METHQAYHLPNRPGRGESHHLGWSGIRTSGTDVVCIFRPGNRSGCIDQLSSSKPNYNTTPRDSIVARLDLLITEAIQNPLVLMRWPLSN